VALIQQEPGGPRVVHKLLHPENEDRPRRTPRAVLLHTVVDAEGDTELAPYEDREDVSTAVTFYVHSNEGSRLDGQIDQLLDTEVRCVASGAADGWAIAVETEDNSAGHQHDIDALTPKALASYIWLCRKLRQIHPTIPARRCTAATGPGAYGFGYHSQPMRERWGGSSHNPWTKYQGKTCPGDRKVRQYEAQILPAVLDAPAPDAPAPDTPKEWDEMATRDEIADVVREEVAVAVMAVTGDEFPADQLRETDVYNLRDLSAELRAGVVAVGVQVIQQVGHQQGVAVDETKIAQAVTDELARRLGS